MTRIKKAKLILWAILGFSSTIMVARFIFGLGATTNLNDGTPWGIWIGFDVMGGVALAAGGFVITALFYVMKRDEFHPMVRPAVLTAFLGYLAVAVGLLFDLGLPWHIWHMIIHWQPGSPLFEVGWCVMLYLTVLALEFFPVPLESTSRFSNIRRFLTKYRLVFVILGIMLSTLHQSSLGSLFLIMPYRLPEFWYSSILPIYFFITAISLGLMMVSLESLVTTYLYHKKQETKLVAKLGVVARWVLGFYLIIKIIDLTGKGALGKVFAGTFESNLFLSETLIMVIIPIILLSIKKVRENNKFQFLISFMVVGGVVFNRLNVGGITHMKNIGMSYFPSWMEIAISAGVVSGAALIFFFAVEHFNIWEKQPKDVESETLTKPIIDKHSQVWFGSPAVSGRIKYSAAFVIAAALALAFIPYSSIQSGGLEKVPAKKARGGEILKIDGNDDGFFVNFKHKFHEEINGEKESCIKCHHMNVPEDQNTTCNVCHQDMFLTTNIFDHSLHQTELGNNQSCIQCHAENTPKSITTVKTCQDCHTDSLSIYVKNSPIKSDSYIAVSYVDAMHNLCITCHQQKKIELEKPNLALCTTCHTGETDAVLTEGEKWRAMHYNSWVVTPSDSICKEVIKKLEK